MTGANVPDGVRPRAAVCLHCGYRFGGLPVKSGAITCPECGGRSEFGLPARPGRGSRPRPRLWSGGVSWVSVAAGTLILAAVMYRRMGPGVALLTAAIGIGLAAIVGGLRALRRTPLHDQG